MIYLTESINNLLKQLQDVLENLSDKQYTMPVVLLSNSTIGQHTRHIIEIYSELNKGYDNGIIHYERRKRDPVIESDRQFAIQKLYEISKSLIKLDKVLSLAVDYTTNDENEQANVSTNYFRELVYNLEHTVHHMALMRIGIAAVSDFQLPETFGVALSTLKFRKACT
jgi:hypothetical protein